MGFSIELKFLSIVLTKVLTIVKIVQQQNSLQTLQCKVEPDNNLT